jgi:hypothetical protein
MQGGLFMLDVAVREEGESRRRGLRTFFVHVLLMFFVSIVVFVVAAYFFIIPHLIEQEIRIAQLSQRVSDLEDRASDVEQVLDEVLSDSESDGSPKDGLEADGESYPLGDDLDGTEDVPQAI